MQVHFVMMDLNQFVSDEHRYPAGYFFVDVIQFLYLR
jgi:hypothetical protein